MLLTGIGYLFAALPIRTCTCRLCELSYNLVTTTCTSVPRSGEVDYANGVTTNMCTFVFCEREREIGYRTHGDNKIQSSSVVSVFILCIIQW